MQYKNILFDLDGTLIDSGEGVIKSSVEAMRQLGKAIPTDGEMRTFVGPPLVESFMRFGCTEAEAQEAIRLYRERYATVGKFELFVYPGIEELLRTLRAAGCHLFVATSKPQTVSIEILEHRGLAGYFDLIAGATFDGERSTKAEVIDYLLGEVGSMESVLMVGDTGYDIRGARAHGIPTAAVTWGYGTAEELRENDPAAIVETTEALAEYILGC